jgi:hypothetical protein
MCEKLDPFRDVWQNKIIKNNGPFMSDGGLYDFLSVARWWINNDKNAVLNTFSSAVIWSLWTLRNEFCFQGKTWSRLDVVRLRIIINVRRWRLLCKDAHTSLLDRNLLLLEKTRSELLRIAWR